VEEVLAKAIKYTRKHLDHNKVTVPVRSALVEVT
jgi:hypothetical protein